MPSDFATLITLDTADALVFSLNLTLTCLLCFPSLAFDALFAMRSPAGCDASYCSILFSYSSNALALFLALLVEMLLIKFSAVAL